MCDVCAAKQIDAGIETYVSTRIVGKAAKTKNRTKYTEQIRHNE